MPEINKLNEAKCQYCIPMGKPGAVIIKAPVVLSIINVSIPINKKFRIDNFCSKMEIVSNKISIKTLEINKDNKLFINGNMHKSIRCFRDKINSKLEMDIPINSEILINFDQMPIYNKKKSKEIFYEESNKINCKINFVELIKDRILKLDSIYCNEVILCITITLTQIQDIFIPEPEGDFILTSTNLKETESYKNCNFNYLVGYDNDKGLVANKLRNNK